MSASRKRCAWLIIAVFLLYTACTDQQSGLQLLQIRRERVFRIDTHNRLSGIGNFYQPVGSEHIYFIDPPTVRLFDLDLKNGRFTAICLLPDVEFLDAFEVDERNHRILIHSEGVIHTYDWKGRAIGTFAIPQPKGGFLSVYNRNFLPVRNDGKLYVQYFGDVKGSYRNPATFKAPVEAGIDLKTHRIQLVPQIYPANYQRWCYGYQYTADRMEIAPEIHAYAFPCNDSLFLCNLQTGEHTTHYFGSRAPKQIRHLDFRQLSHLHEDAFTELVDSNPHYLGTKNAPLSGYYLRELVWRKKKHSMHLNERLVIYDREFNYIGESKPTFVARVLADSKKGLLSISFSPKTGIITVDRLIW